jgi:hypothetical protein
VDPGGVGRGGRRIETGHASIVARARSTPDLRTSGASHVPRLSCPP